MAGERMVDDLGAFLKQQRHSAQMSLRQLASAAGVSNPYLSQIERGLRRPSAEVLQQIARGLQISSSALYVRAGLLDDVDDDLVTPPVADEPQSSPAVSFPGVTSAVVTSAVVTSAVVTAIASDPHLAPAQRRALIDVYTAFVNDGRAEQE